jgi:hypothetical protein
LPPAFFLFPVISLLYFSLNVGPLTWFFVSVMQMDGLAQSNDLVFLLAATNLPWQLDAALLRRLEKRVS